mgnify:CR=1 FL=1
MVSVNAKGLTKQRSPLSPLGSTNGALPRNDGTAKKSALHDMQKFLDTEEFSIEPTADKNPSTEASDEPIAADPFRTAISDSSIGSANEFVEMVKKPPTNAGLVVHAKGQSRMSVTCCNATLGVWRMNGQLLIPAGQGCKYTTLKQDYSVTHTCSPNDLNALYWEVYKLAMQEKPGYTFEMVELGPENSKKVQCCPCFDSEKANLDADDEHPVADALTNVYVAQRPAFKKRSDPSANTLTVLAPHFRQKYSEEGSRFKSIFAAATSTSKIKDTTAEPLTQLVEAAKDEASQAKLFGVRRHTQPPRRLGSRVAQPPRSRHAAAAPAVPRSSPRAARRAAGGQPVCRLADGQERRDGCGSHRGQAHGRRPLHVDRRAGHGARAAGRAGREAVQGGRRSGAGGGGAGGGGCARTRGGDRAECGVP